MADTVTPKMGLTKPEIGGSPDTWGNKLNANLDIVDAKAVRNTSKWNLDLGDGAGNPQGHMFFNRYNPDNIFVDYPFYLDRNTGNAYFTKGMNITLDCSIGASCAIYGQLSALASIITPTLNVSGVTTLSGSASIGTMTNAPIHNFLNAPAAPPAQTSRLFFNGAGNLVIQRPDGSIEYAGVPPGAITWTGSFAADTGWALLNGQAISRAANPALYGRYGDFYGAGNGSTTFNLPDVRGRVIAHNDTGAGRLVPGFAGGMSGTGNSAVGGLAYHAITADEIINHRHSVNIDTGASVQDLNHRHAATVPGVQEADNPQNNAAASGSGPVIRSRTPRDINIDTGYVDLTNHGHHVIGDTGFVGGSNAHNNMQPTIVLSAQVKLG